MPIEIEEDYEEADGGFAIVTLSKSIGDNDSAVQIKRLAGEPDKLGPKGWQANDAMLAPLAVRDVGGRSALYFGPEVTQHLLEDTEVEITVPALKSVERVIWPYITPSVHADGGRGSMGGAPQTLETDVVVGGNTDEEDDTGGHGVGPGGDPIDPEEDEEIGRGPGPGIEEEVSPKRGFSLLWLLPIAALAAVAVYALTSRQSDEVDTETQEVVETTPSADDQTTEVAEGDTPESLTEAARACLADDCDGNAFHDIALRLQDVGVSDVFAIMNIAAERGSLPAMEWLANAYDPLHFEVRDGLSSPDLVSAFGYYADAEAAGSQLANAAKTTLCEALSDPGDADWATLISEDVIRSAHEGNCP